MTNPYTPGAGDREGGDGPSAGSPLRGAEDRAIILSLCDYSGTWSEPYLAAGYDVRRVDIQRGQDIRFLRHLDRQVVGILAAPPCTHFSRAGAHLWKRKGDSAIAEGLAVVDACLRAVAIYQPTFWALENPIGRLKDYLGEPQYKFHPYYFGDAYTKRTWLWGKFNAPKENRVEPTVINWVDKLSSSNRNGRSKTPAGFARAFFEANNPLQLQAPQAPRSAERAKGPLPATPEVTP